MRGTGTPASGVVVSEVLEMAVGIVTAYFARNHLPASEVPAAVRSVLGVLKELSSGVSDKTRRTPAVSMKKSVSDDHLICLEDGKSLTMLKRYLKTHFNMSPEEYRKKWGLPPDHPMVAPAYARLRVNRHGTLTPFSG